MVFRIKTQSGGYLAPVLAMDKNGDRFLVPDEQGGDLVILPMIDKNELGHILIRAMVVEPSVDGWRTFADIPDWEGEVWMTEHPALLRDLLAGRKPAPALLRMALHNAAYCLKQFDPYAWRPLKGAQDIDDLLETAGGFHDASLADYREVQGSQGQGGLLLRFESFWMLPIEIRFADVVSYRLENCIRQDESFFYELYSAGLFFENGNLYWVDDADVTEAARLVHERIVKPPVLYGKPAEEQVSFIDHDYACAKSAVWRVVLPEDTVITGCRTVGTR